VIGFRHASLLRGTLRCESHLRGLFELLVTLKTLIMDEIIFDLALQQTEIGHLSDSAGLEPTGAEGGAGIQ